MYQTSILGCQHVQNIPFWGVDTSLVDLEGLTPFLKHVHLELGIIYIQDRSISKGGVFKQFENICHHPGTVA